MPFLKRERATHTGPSAIGTLAFVLGLVVPIAVDAEIVSVPSEALSSAVAALPPPTVLRGSPPSTAKSVPICPPGYTLAPGDGCLPPSTGDYGYPYSYAWNWAGYPWGWGWGAPWGWGSPVGVSVGFGRCWNCGFRGAFFRPRFARFGFAHPGFFHSGFGRFGFGRFGFAHPGFAHPGFAHTGFGGFRGGGRR